MPYQHLTAFERGQIQALFAEGVGSNWVGFLGPEAVKPLLGIPDDLELLAIVSFGYPARDSSEGKKNRKPLAAVASRERYGVAFE